MKVTPPDELSRLVHHPSPAKEKSLTLYTPKGKAEANSLTNGHRSHCNRCFAVLPGEDRATLESDLSALGSPSRGNPLGGHKVSYRERIAAYLGAHGPAPIKAIAQASRIKANAVNVTLHQGKGKLFCHFKAERTWGVNE